MAYWLFLLTVAVASPEQLAWQKHAEKGDITVWTRPIPNSPIKEVKAEATMPFAREVLWRIVTDLEHYPEFMPHVVEAFLIQKDPENQRRIEYLKVKPPFVSPRDYTLRTRWLKPEPVQAAWHVEWTIANEAGPPPQDGVVRLVICDGSWTIQPMGPGQSHVTYWLKTDPGGSLPAWITNMANESSLPDILRAVRKRADALPVPTSPKLAVSPDSKP